jgi:S1-C subfamily serine protease
MLKYYKVGDKIKQYEDVLYTIDTSAGTVDKTYIWSDEYSKFIDRLFLSQYESGELPIKMLPWQKVSTEKFTIESYTGGFIVTKSLKDLFKEDILNIDLKNSIVYVNSNWVKDEFDYTSKIQCNYESYKTETKTASGSGFFINNKGYFVTNYHVVADCNDKSKITFKEKDVDAKLIAKDESLDLALLRAKVKPKSYLYLSADLPEKIQTIFVAGYPFGKGLSDDLKITKGVISSLKGFGDNSNEIQIDAAINPGNSGGPIVNDDGELMAVAVSGLAKDQSEGINFGIKASSVKNFLDVNKAKYSTSSLTKFSMSNKKLNDILEESTVYTFCN